MIKLKSLLENIKDEKAFILLGTINKETLEVHADKVYSAFFQHGREYHRPHYLRWRYKSFDNTLYWPETPLSLERDSVLLYLERYNIAPTAKSW